MKTGRIYLWYKIRSFISIVLFIVVILAIIYMFTLVNIAAFGSKVENIVVPREELIKKNG